MLPVSNAPEVKPLPLQRTDCCSALLRLKIEARKGELTQEEILTQKTWALSQIPQDKICHTCHTAFTTKPFQSAKKECS